MMPTRANKPCTTIGCRRYAVVKGKCKQHAKQVNQERGTASSRGYGVTWQRVRKLVLDDEPLCRRCKAEGKAVVAAIVHHIDHDQTNNSRVNLEPICRTHHAEEHKDEYNVF